MADTCRRILMAGLKATLRSKTMVLTGVISFPSQDTCNTKQAILVSISCSLILVRFFSVFSDDICN